MKKVIVMRGVSGSGKSTKAKELAENVELEERAYICSADKYFVDPVSGQYNFNAKLLGQAHAWCRGNAHASCELGVDLILIDNTNTRKNEYEPYRKMAEQFGYEFETCVVGQLDESNLKVYANRNAHGVSLDIIRKQAKRFEK